MNKDAYLIFEAYKKKNNNVISEAPVTFEPEYTGTGEEVKAQFPELAQGKYALNDQEAAAVLSKFIANFKTEGGKSPMLYKDFLESKISPLVREVNPKINNTNSKYTARVLYNALRAAGAVKDERDGVEGVKGGKTEHSIKKVAQVATENPQEFIEGEEVADEKPIESQDSTTTRIANWVFDEIDSVTGASEQDIISGVQRKIMSSGGLGLEEKSIVSKVKGVLNILISNKVLEKKAGRVIFGSNFEKFEQASDDTSNIGRDPLEIAKDLGYEGSPEHQLYGRGSQYWSKQD